jgi:hypothetical protein
MTNYQNPINLNKYIFSAAVLNIFYKTAPIKKNLINYISISIKKYPRKTYLYQSKALTKVRARRKLLTHINLTQAPQNQEKIMI